MNRILIVVIASALASCAQAPALAQIPPTLLQIATVTLPNVTGRIDHLAFDPDRQRLFVAALGNDTVEVIDTATQAIARSLSGFHEPQGMAFDADLAAIAIANGGTGTLQLVDALTLATRWTITIGGDADNVRYDAPAKRVYVAAEGGLYAVDPSAGKPIGRIRIDGHPESFQLDPASGRTFANLPGLLSSQIIAADRSRMSVTAEWKPECGGNYPMALDAATSRLFVGCRRPARVAMVDTASGRTITSAEIVGDTDDLFYDHTRRRVYVIGGDGFIDVLTRDEDRLQRVERIATRGGARTGLWVGDQNRLYVAVPARGGQPAEIRVFEAGK